MLLLLLAACELLDPEKAGIFGCDDYCDQLVDKAEECAAEAGQDLDQFLGAVDDKYTGMVRADVVGSCNEQIADKSESSCQAETGTFNNIPCETLVGGVDGL
jgi:hypothetical protein